MPSTNTTWSRRVIPNRNYARSRFSPSAPRRLGGSFLLFLIVFATCGCASLGTPELTNRVAALDQPTRDNVHVYLINSPLDQLAIGRLGDVAKYLRKAGFENSHYWHWATGAALTDKLLEIRAANPNARIALVGWSGGSLAVWDAATALEEQQQIVDMAVYLDSNWIKGRIEDRGHPNNIIRLVLIYRQNNDPPDLPAAKIYRIPPTNHMAIPAEPETIEALVDELIATATQTR